VRKAGGPGFIGGWGACAAGPAGAPEPLLAHSGGVGGRSPPSTSEPIWPPTGPVGPGLVRGGDPPGLSRIRGSLGPEGLRPPFCWDDGRVSYVWCWGWLRGRSGDGSRGGGWGGRSPPSTFDPIWPHTGSVVFFLLRWGEPPGLSRIRGSLGPEGLRPPFYGLFSPY
jgi:hypothetical protein